ncbi:PREDICTED: uncharacterized protein LOC104714923 [Camelina sativa]|uniref:Uncharacterized protein LOC104714923 n=1 Tax=Camelina sativa TaxID=90675 RepID=A0ABM0TSQ0_CAMSA|nr:PREDICTED: uncharacterized protein LOC104714923 [Camelina sativa]
MNVRPFVQLDNLNPALDHQKIRVRIIRLWKSFKSLQMVFVDSDGTRIHASIEDGLFNRFQNQLAVGESKIVDTFSLVDYANVIGQIVSVGNLNSVKTKGKDNVKLSFDLQDLTYVTLKPKVTLYEEFFIVNEKSTMDQIVYALEDDTAPIPGSLSALVGRTMLFKISITIKNLKSDKSAYVVEKFWEKEDMVVQFGKELYGRNEL